MARLADGALRDGLSLLDQCASATTDELNADRVYACLGIAGIQQSGALMNCIAEHDTGKALTIMNRLYADGKDLGALLDELACLTRDLMVMKTAPREGISMLSGVASDSEVSALVQRFSSGELARMMNIIQSTLAGFTRNASRRMDAELCIISLCQPEMNTDMDALLARLTKLEDQVRTGAFPATQIQVNTQLSEEPGADQPPLPDDEDAPPVRDEAFIPDPISEAPVGFWTDVAAAVRSEMKTPAAGFFATSPDAPVRGVLHGDLLTLICANSFTKEIINKPDIIALVARKASVKLGRNIKVTVTDETRSAARSKQMEDLLRFGREHSDRINIK